MCGGTGRDRARASRDGVRAQKGQIRGRVRNALLTLIDDRPRKVVYGRVRHAGKGQIGPIRVRFTIG